MAKGKAHGDEVKAAVMAALLTGQGVSEIAAQFDLPESSVRNWKKALGPEKLAEISGKKSEQIEELLFGYLTANLTALRAQANEVAKPEYIKKQPASEIATLHGVMADKAFRILEAAERAGILENESGGD